MNKDIESYIDEYEIIQRPMKINYENQINNLRTLLNQKVADIRRANCVLLIRQFEREISFGN